MSCTDCSLLSPDYTGLRLTKPFRHSSFSSYCTGFEKDNRGHIYQIIGNDIKLEPVWNLDKEGEIRGVFRPSGHPGVFIQGGELQTMRYYGRFLALQVAAVLAGVRPEPVRA